MRIGDQYLGRANWNIGVRDVINPSVLGLLGSNAVLIIWALIERWLLDYTKMTDVNLAEYARLQPLPPTNDQSSG